MVESVKLDDDGRWPAGTVTRHTMAGASVVRLTGDIDLSVTRELGRTLRAAVAEQPWIIVDVSRAEIYDSVGLSVLLTAASSARRAGGDLLLAGPSDFLRTVLRSARLSSSFRLFDTVPRAITAALAGREAAALRHGLRSA